MFTFTTVVVVVLVKLVFEELEELEEFEEEVELEELEEDELPDVLTTIGPKAEAFRRPAEEFFAPIPLDKTVLLEMSAAPDAGVVRNDETTKKTKGKIKKLLLRLVILIRECFFKISRFVRW